MALPSRSMSGTPSFKERIKQTLNNSPGPSNSPNTYAGGPSAGNFTSPSVSQKASKSSSGGPKAPKPPEKPLMPYMRYSRKVWDSVKAQNTEMKLWEIGRLIGQMWRELPDSDKREYNEGYEADRTVWQEKLKVYHNSPAYQQYLREKQRSEQILAEEEKRSKQGKAEQRVSIAPAEYESDDGGMSIRTIAATRYHRNHTLINQIFNETCVPDPRSVVKEQRLLSLRKQVDMIHVHQTKIEEEMVNVAEKYQEKKRKFAESTEEFNKKLKQICDSKPVVSKEKFNDMVESHKKELKEKYDASQLQQRKEREALEVIQRAQAIAHAEIQANQSAASGGHGHVQIHQPIHEPITPPSVEAEAEPEANVSMDDYTDPSNTMQTDSRSAKGNVCVHLEDDDDDVMDRSTDPEDEDEELDNSMMSDKPDSTIHDMSVPFNAPPFQPALPPALPEITPYFPRPSPTLPTEATAAPEAPVCFPQALPTLPGYTAPGGQFPTEVTETPDSTSIATQPTVSTNFPYNSEPQLLDLTKGTKIQSTNQEPETSQ